MDKLKYYHIWELIDHKDEVTDKLISLLEIIQCIDSACYIHPNTLVSYVSQIDDYTRELVKINNELERRLKEK